MARYSTLWILILLLTGLRPAAANSTAPDSEDRAAVIKATTAFYAALNHGDPKAADEYLLPGGDSFPRNGNELSPEPPTQEASLQSLTDIFDNGLRFNVVIRDLRVRTYGIAAVATFYLMGSSSLKGQVLSNRTFRASYVWAKIGGKWKIAHFHISPLTK